MSQVGYIYRYLLVIRLIRRRKYISLEDLTISLQKEMSYYDDTGCLGYSTRTMKRIIKNTRECLGVNIEYSKTYRGYFISEDEELPSDLEKMLESINLFGSLHVDKKLFEFVFIEKRKSRGTEHLLPLIYAVKKRLITEFLYLKYDNTSSYVRKVEPYALKEFKGRWYLLATEIGGRIEEKGEIKTWGLDRVQDLYVTHEVFCRNGTLKLKEEFEQVFGIYSNKDLEVEEVILSFSPLGGKYNEAFPLHETQETLVDDENEYRIKLEVKLTHDFIMELLSQSENMRVISPLHLKEKMINIHKAAIALLGKDG